MFEGKNQSCAGSWRVLLKIKTVVHFVRQWTSTGYLKSYKGHHSTILVNTRTTLERTCLGLLMSSGWCHTD
jgi:hypothetical protein